MEEVIRSISDQKLLSQIERVVPFHGYLSTGAFVGIQIFNIAKRELGFSEGERLFVICETFGCMPDAFQVLGGCTIGNRGLLIEDRGKMAATFSRRASGGGQQGPGGEGLPRPRQDRLLSEAPLLVHEGREGAPPGGDL